MALIKMNMDIGTYEHYYRGIYSKGSHVNLGLVRYLSQKWIIPSTILLPGFNRHRLRAKAEYMVHGGAFHGFSKTK